MVIAKTKSITKYARPIILIHTQASIGILLVSKIGKSTPSIKHIVSTINVAATMDIIYVVPIIKNVESPPRGDVSEERFYLFCVTEDVNEEMTEICLREGEVLIY